MVLPYAGIGADAQPFGRTAQTMVNWRAGAIVLLVGVVGHVVQGLRWGTQLRRDAGLAIAISVFLLIVAVAGVILLWLGQGVGKWIVLVLSAIFAAAFLSLGLGSLSRDPLVGGLCLVAGALNPMAWLVLLGEPGKKWTLGAGLAMLVASASVYVVLIFPALR
jgi:hypothetical protein